VATKKPWCGTAPSAGEPCWQDRGEGGLLSEGWGGRAACHVAPTSGSTHLLQGGGCALKACAACNLRLESGLQAGGVQLPCRLCRPQPVSAGTRKGVWGFSPHWKLKSLEQECSLQARNVRAKRMRPAFIMVLLRPATCLWMC